MAALLYIIPMGSDIFAGCVFLFQLADAGQDLAQGRNEAASLLIAGLIVVPQILVALLSPWVKYYSEKWGRKPLLLVGFALETARAALFAFSTDYAVGCHAGDGT
jgi:MFS family permease